MKKHSFKEFPRLSKIVEGLFASMVAIIIVLLLVGLVDWTDWKLAEPGQYQSPLIVDILSISLLVILYFFITASIAILLYVCFAGLLTGSSSDQTETQPQPQQLAQSSPKELKIIGSNVTLYDNSTTLNVKQ